MAYQKQQRRGQPRQPRVQKDDPLNPPPAIDHLRGLVSPPPKPGGTGGAGLVGRPIKLSVNHFAVKLKKNTLYHYDIDIQPAPPKGMFGKVFERFVEHYPKLKDAVPVHDSKRNIITARRIEGLTSRVCVDFVFEERDGGGETETRKFKVFLQPTREIEIDLSALVSYCDSGKSTNIPLRPIQALDIIMKHGATLQSNKVITGGSILAQPGKGRTVDLGNGAEVWFGHFQSLRLGWKPFMNIDASQKVFHGSGKVHEIMAKMYRMEIGRRLGPDEYYDFGKKISNLKVKYSRGSYETAVACNGLKGPANVEKFLCDGRTVTVQQYFEDRLNVRLQYPHLPCVWVGSRQKKNLVPMELCTIPPGQEYKRKLSDFQTSEIIKMAATPAPSRKEKILESVHEMNFKEDYFVKQFGISVDDRMMKIQGRVLPAPKLAYGREEKQTIVPKDGTWNMRNFHFIDPKLLKFFGVINLTDRCNEQDIRTFISALTRAGSEMGMSFGQSLFIANCQPQELERCMVFHKERYSNLQVLFIIIQRKGDSAYEVAKRVGDLNLRLTTQCIQFKNVLGRKGPDPATMANLCLKLNAKLGGINNSICREVRPQILLREQVIIMGADVTHPGADQQGSGKPSLAAVVASMDPKGSQYSCEIRIQKSKQEYIEDMEIMVMSLLKKFYRVNGSVSNGKPQRIIFYRDGVSEGQFAKVLEHELTAIRRACTRLESGYEPPITFIVVQKRHHTRLFPEDAADEVGRGRNVPPGTVVDTTIVHPVEHDFFLVSHLGIQGTSRPTHYHVLWDDSNMPVDEIQTLTYYLCYMFNRCTRSVSYPAPCYYSHLVAYRARQYYDGITRLNARISSAELQREIDGIRDLSFMFFV